MKNRDYVLITLVLIVLATLNLKFNKKPDKDSTVEYIPDTVYVHDTYKPLDGFKLVQVPHLVMFYSEENVKIDTVYVDSTKIEYILPSGNISFNHQFLLNYKDNNKLIQLSTSDNHLQLTQLDKNGLIHTDRFKFEPEFNYYRYQNGALTYKKKPLIQNLEFGAEVMVRPLANLYDFNLGVRHNTSKIYYEIGFNSYFYPIQNYPWGFTPYLKVGIKF